MFRSFYLGLQPRRLFDYQNSRLNVVLIVTNKMKWHTQITEYAWPKPQVCGLGTVLLSKIDNFGSRYMKYFLLSYMLSSIVIFGLRLFSLRRKIVHKYCCFIGIMLLDYPVKFIGTTYKCTTLAIYITRQLDCGIQIHFPRTMRPTYPLTQSQ